MQIRTVSEAETEIFIRAGGSPEDREAVMEYVERMFRAGSMRPEWCFVAEEESRPLGRVALWTLPGADSPMALVLLDADRGAGFAAVGEALLEAACERARELGSAELEHVLDDPPMSPQFQYDPEGREAILKAVRFSRKRETDRFEYRGEEPPEAPDRLRLRTLEEVGEEAFVEAMMRVSEDTLDQEILEEIGSLGPEKAAREFFNDARKVEHEPAWWRLAYEEEGGELAGLVMPAHPPTLATIFYVGVVPEKRGRGYIDGLLATGTETLLKASRESGAPLRADTDVSNAPMAAAFERAGWRRFAKRREYGRKLTTSE